MKNKDNRLDALKYRLKEKKAAGEAEVIWHLRDEQKEYLEKIGYQVIPWLYIIKTKTIPNVKKSGSKLLKDVHFAKQRGCTELYKKLSNNDRELLTEFGVHYSEFKYKIIL